MVVARFFSGICTVAWRSNLKDLLPADGAKAFLRCRHEQEWRRGRRRKRRREERRKNEEEERGEKRRKREEERRGEGRGEERREGRGEGARMRETGEEREWGRDVSG